MDFALWGPHDRRHAKDRRSMALVWVEAASGQPALQPRMLTGPGSYEMWEKHLAAGYTEQQIRQHWQRLRVVPSMETLWHRNQWKLTFAQLGFLQSPPLICGGNRSRDSAKLVQKSGADTRI